MSVVLRIQQYACYAVIKLAFVLAKNGKPELLNGVIDSFEKAKANLKYADDKKSVEDILSAVKQEANEKGIIFGVNSHA